MSPALALFDATVRRGETEVLASANLTVQAGEVVAVVGPNGAGKTTLLRAALGLAGLATGRAELAGRDLSGLDDATRATLAGYLPQERRVGWNLPAWRIVSLGAALKPPALAQVAARTALARVGLSNLAERGVLDLSGGERARVLLARLLATSAPLLVADEPASGLDPEAQLLSLELFHEEAARGAAVVLTLHDLGLAARSCDRLVVVGSGRIVADGAPPDALTPAVLREVFGLDGALEQTSAGLTVAARRAV